MITPEHLRQVAQAMDDYAVRIDLNATKEQEEQLLKDAMDALMRRTKGRLSPQWARDLLRPFLRGEI